MVSQNALADSDEQKDLRDTVRRLLRDKVSLDALRAGSAPDAALWKSLAELGLLGLAIPEVHDGLGQTALETSIVFEEMGRALYHGPYLACVGLAVPALLAAGDEAVCGELLPAIGAGDCVATLAFSGDLERWTPAVTAAESDGEWRLSGVEPVVLDGADADVVLVAARTGASDPSVGPAEVSLFVVRSDADGLTREPLESLDRARSVARVTLDGAPARLVGTPGGAPAALAAAYRHALVALAAEQSGGAGACLDASVEYAKTRQQFGQVIGSYQAVAHKCVDMLHGAEFSRASARYAAAALAQDAPDAAEAARVAAAYCGEAYRSITVETVQVHGGIGFTWEHDTHLYYRRAWSAQHLFGTTDQHYQALAALTLAG